MAAEFMKLYEANPELRKIRKIIEVLQSGGVIIYPTDTVYGMGCDLHNARAIERVRKLRHAAKRSDLTFICHDISEVSKYARVDTPSFKTMKRALPGPYTFILRSSSQVPKILNERKKTVGIRIPDNHIPREIVRELGHPILSASIRNQDELIGYTTDPELIYEAFRHQVDLIVDGGFSGNMPSTIVDLSTNEMEIVREGKGALELLQ